MGFFLFLNMIFKYALSMDSKLKQIGTSTTQVSKEISADSLIKIELLFGEQVEVLEEGERTKIRTVNSDAYEGYLDAHHLVDCFENTHRVSVRSAPTYYTASFKNPTEGEPLYLNSLVRVVDSKETPEGLLHKLEGNGWVFASQLVEKTHRAADYVEECLKFLGDSYGYERRGALIDCSTLVQAGCIAVGIECPYDVKSGQMEKLGEEVPLREELDNLQRGDLIFWTQDKGSHVVIMINEKECLHATIANPYRKALVQPLSEVVHDQARDNNGPITGVRRFPQYGSL